MTMSGRSYNPKPCLICKSLQFGIKKIDLPIISETVCETCANRLTIGEFSKVFKWTPTIVKEKILNQIINTI